MAFASWRVTYAVSFPAAIYSGSRSADGSAPFFRIIPASASSCLASLLSYASNPTFAAVPSAREITVTVPAGSTAPSVYPSRGSPSFAVRILLSSGVNVTMSGCTPVSYACSNVSVPSSLQVNTAMRPLSAYPSAWIAAASFAPSAETATEVISPYVKPSQFSSMMDFTSILLPSSRSILSLSSISFTTMAVRLPVCPLTAYAHPVAAL